MRILSICFAVGLLLGVVYSAAEAWAAVCADIDHVYNTGIEACHDNYGYDDYMGVKYRDNTGAGSTLCAQVGASDNISSLTMGVGWDAFSTGSNCGQATGGTDGKTTALLTLKVIHRADPCDDATHTTRAAFAGGSSCGIPGSTAHSFVFGPTYCECP